MKTTLMAMAAMLALNVASARFIDSNDKKTGGIDSTEQKNAKVYDLREIVVDSHNSIEVAKLKMDDMLRITSHDDALKSFLYLPGVTASSSVTAVNYYHGLSDFFGVTAFPAGIMSSLPNTSVMSIQGTMDNFRLHPVLDMGVHDAVYPATGAVIKQDFATDMPDLLAHADLISGSVDGKLPVVDQKNYAMSASAGGNYLSIPGFMSKINKDLKSVPDYASLSALLDSRLMTEKLNMSLLVYGKIAAENKRYDDSDQSTDIDLLHDHSLAQQVYGKLALDGIGHQLLIAGIVESDKIEFSEIKSNTADKLNSRSGNESLSMILSQENDLYAFGINFTKASSTRKLSLNAPDRSTDEITAEDLDVKAMDNTINVTRYWLSSKILAGIDIIEMSIGGTNFEHKGLWNASIKNTVLATERFSVSADMSHLSNVRLYPTSSPSNPYLQSSTVIPEQSYQAQLGLLLAQSENDDFYSIFNSLSLSFYANYFKTDFNGFAQGHSRGADFSYNKYYDDFGIRLNASANHTDIADRPAPGAIGLMANLVLYANAGKWQFALSARVQQGPYYVNIHTGEYLQLHKSFYLDPSVSLKVTDNIEIRGVAYNIGALFNNNSEIARFRAADGKDVSIGVPSLFNLSVNLRLEDK